MSDRLLDYDVVAFPGGRGVLKKLRDNDKLMKLMQKRNAENKVGCRNVCCSDCLGSVWLA